MTKVEGWGYGVVGLRGVPGIDAAGNILVAVWLLGRRKLSSTTFSSKPG